MKSNKILKYSIILCTHNGEAKIAKSLESLIALDFPKEAFEIIVVDDGSTDTTCQVVSPFPVILITHKNNKGLAASRNTGLANARGEIVICYDDDCVTDKQWLRQLDKAYDDPMVMGAGGMLRLPTHPNITDIYCLSCGYGNPIPLTYGNSKSALKRFFDYLKTNFSNSQQLYKERDKVLELPGIVASFRKDKLITVGGWNEDFTNNAEDIELCRRLRFQFPSSYFVVMPKAKVVHEQKLAFITFLKKEFRRGNLRKKYYQLKGETPPYFPGPFIFLLMAIILSVINKALFIIGLPFLIYPWWFFRAINERKVLLLLFSYLQLLHEGVTILGMVLL